MLVTLWTADTGRFTRDIDFLAFGSDEEVELKEAFSKTLVSDGGDGLIYGAANLRAAAIREDQVCACARLPIWEPPRFRGSGQNMGVLLGALACAKVSSLGGELPWMFEFRL